MTAIVVSLVLWALFAAAAAVVVRELAWVRRCPLCCSAMRQQYGDRGPWLCPSCGWSA